MNQYKKIKMEKVSLINLFKSCLNILRDGEGLTGEKALRNMSYLLIIKLIEPHINKTVIIDDYKFDFSHIDDSIVEAIKKQLFTNIKFSNLAKNKDDDLVTIIIRLWDEILSVHPATNKIFLKGFSFNIKKQATFRKLIDKINALDTSETDFDILGNSYEEVIKDIMTGRVLGQFFTQPIVKKIMVKLINPQIFPDGKIETCGDPTMGTGGFLISYLKHILEQAKEKKIEPDWNFIKTEGIYGKEIDSDTYNLAVSNMLISSGHLFEHLENGDSIRNPIIRKFDNILANPPFGVKGLSHSEIRHALKFEYIPIISTNAVSMFLQAIIYMLKINGKCAIVLPDGQDLYSHTSKMLINVRKLLLKTCDLKEIIYLPTDSFSYTSIKTCICYFIKKKESSEVLEVKVKGESRSYTFKEGDSTINIKFYNYYPNDEKKLIIEVPIGTIANNDYSLNYEEYLPKKEHNYADNIIVKKIGEICEIVKGNKQQSKDGKEKGLYPLYYCSILGNLYLDTYDYEGEGLILNKTNGSGRAMIYYGHDKYNVGKTTLHFKSKDENVLTKFLYYYLYNNLDIVEKKYRGANQKSIIESDLFSIEIPIPPLESQKIMIKYIDYIENSNKNSYNKIKELKELNNYYVNARQIFIKQEVKKIGEICEFLPKSKRQASYGNPTGKYPFFKSSSKITSYVDDADYKEECLIIGDGGEPNVNYSIEFSASDHCYIIKNKDNTALYLKYVYYYLLNNLEMMEKLYTGVGIKNISKINIKNIEILIPPLERQKAIIEYCDNNNNLTLLLEKEIENNKIEGKKFLESIINK